MSGFLSQCELMALQAIRRRSVFLLDERRIVYVNKLIYWEDELMILGYGETPPLKASEYARTWTLGPATVDELVNLTEDVIESIIKERR